MSVNGIKPEAMLFDMDGTLFQSETNLLPAYHKVFDQLREEGLFRGDTPPDERVLSCLGMLLEDIWRKVIPDEPDEVRLRADELLLHHQSECLRQGQGDLYPGVEETLKELRSRGVRLFVASNGLENYVQLIIEQKGLAPLFENLYSAGKYKTRSKVDLVKLLLDNHGIERAWMVGDRSSDVEAGKKNGLFVVGCDYAGFGSDQELEGSDVRISNFPQLLELLVR